MKMAAVDHELACWHDFTHMPARKSADGTVANLVRSGRKQPQRFRAGSSASTVFFAWEFELALPAWVRGVDQ